MIKVFIILFIIQFLIEPLIINVIYMSNPALFNDLILTKKNSEKLRCYYEKNL